MKKCLRKIFALLPVIFLLGFLFVSTNLLKAQSTAKIEILNADELLAIERNGKKIKLLRGNASFKHQDALMFCDSAYLYEAENNIEAFGSIRIKQEDTMNLYGDHLFYEGNSRLARIDGKEVRLETEDFILYTTELLHDRELKTTIYLKGGRIEGKKDSNTLVSRKGYFYAENKQFTFKDSVVFTNPEFELQSDTLNYFTHTKILKFFGPTRIIGDSNFIYCENGWYNTNSDQSEYYDDSYLISGDQRLSGDTLFYDRKIAFGRSVGNVEIEDTVENIIVYGQLAKLYELKDSVVVTNKSYLVQIMDEDSLFMRADTFKVFKNAEKERQLFAYHDVKIFKTDLQAICDSMAYSFEDSTIKMHHDPVMWTENNQMTAKQIDIHTADGVIESMFLDQDAFVIEAVDSLRYNQIKGKNMTAYFREKEIHLIEVRGNGQTTYYGLDEEDKFIGVNVLESSDLDIEMKNKKIHLIKYLNQPSGIMHPMGELDPVEDLRYEGFQWRIKERPKRSDCVY